MATISTTKTTAKARERYQQILTCRCERGMTIKEAAREMCLEPNTIKNHVTGLLIWMGVQSMNEACFRFGREQTNDR